MEHLFALPLFESNDSLFKVAATVIAPCFAALAVILALLSYRMNRSVARSARFETAVNLTNSENRHVQMMGINLLAITANEDPKRYTRVLFSALSHLIYNDNSDVSRRVGASVYNPEKIIDRFGSDKFHDTSISVSCMEALSAIRIGDKWRRLRLDGPPVITDLFLEGDLFSEEDFGGIRLNESKMGMVQFKNCSFRNSNIEVFVSHTLEFIKCDLRGAEIYLCDWHGVPYDGQDKQIALFVDCKTDQRTKILGRHPRGKPSWFHR